MEVIDVKSAREYVSANYPNDPLLKHIVLNLLDQLPKVRAVALVRIHRKSQAEPQKISLVDEHEFSSARNDLAGWIRSNQTRFYEFAPDNFYYGQIDEEYVYITNRAFKIFCDLYSYDIVDLLRYFDAAGYINSRKGSWHGGHYRSKRMYRNLESCVWLMRDKLFGKEYSNGLSL